MTESGIVEMLTPVEAANIYGLDKFQIYTWIHSRKLKATDVSVSGTKKARWLIREDDLRNFLKDRKEGTTEEIKAEEPVEEKKPEPGKAFVKKKTVDERRIIMEEFVRIKDTMLEMAVRMETLENRLMKLD